MITVREADANDNPELLTLTRATPMHGVISLRIDRDPDFFRLLELRGAGKTFVATAMGRLVGSISVTYRSAFIGGVPEIVGYIGDLKVDPSFRGRWIAYRLLQAMHDFVKTQPVDLYVCMIAEGNDQAVALLQGRRGLPRFEPLGRFQVYSLLPSPMPGRCGPYSLGVSGADISDELVRYINGFNKTRPFAPVLTQQELVGLVHKGASVGHLLAARHNGRLVATLAPFDAGDTKTNVVIDMPRALRVAVGILRLASALIPLPAAPRVGEALRLLYVRHVAFEGEHPRALRMLLQNVRNIAFEQDYSFVILGLHERDPLRRLLWSLPRFIFTSRGFMLSLNDRREVIAQIASGIPVEDFALV